MTTTAQDLEGRKHSLFTTTISGDVDGVPTILGESLTTIAQAHSIGWIAGSLWMGRPLKSQKTEEALDLALRLLVDHGPYVSGAVNTMITARAGKDLVSSLVSGLLTIGPRFGGAINGAAGIWFSAVEKGTAAQDLVEAYASKKEYLPGIGHRKYRMDTPDPRVGLIKDLVKDIKHPHLDLALAVEAITTGKKPNLILNVDGAIAAVLLDLLVKEEDLSKAELDILIKAEFFNAIFVASRSIGFIAHYLDQKRLGEPLFRLEDNQVLTK
jgi:citrate synthase